MQIQADDPSIRQMNVNASTTCGTGFIHHLMLTSVSTAVSTPLSDLLQRENLGCLLTYSFSKAFD